MRITFVLPALGLHGGIRVPLIYAERLQNRGHDVFVASMPARVPLRRKLKAFLYGRGWPTNGPTPPYSDTKSIPPHVLAAGRSVSDADVPDADVIISTFYTTAHAVDALHPSKGAKAIFIQ